MIIGININTVLYILKFAYERSLGFLNSRDWIIAVVVYWVSLSFFSFRRYGRKAFYLAMLISYIFIMYMFTVFERPSRGNYIVELMPFWSYQQIRMGNTTLLLEVVLNVLMFIPIGIFLRLVDLSFTKMLLTAFVLSYSVEIMQLVFQKGYCEFFDDPLHNQFGAIVGFGFTSILLLAGRKIMGYFDGR